MKIEDYKERLRAAIESATGEGTITDVVLDTIVEVIQAMQTEQIVVRSIPEPELRRMFEVYKPPFKYSDDFQAIVTVDDKVVTTHVRGWSFLQQLPDGIQVQDNMGKLLVELLNEEYERLKR